MPLQHVSWIPLDMPHRHVVVSSLLQRRMLDCLPWKAFVHEKPTQKKR